MIKIAASNAIEKSLHNSIKKIFVKVKAETKC